MASKNNINWFMWIGFLTIAVAVTGFCVEVSNKFQPTVAQVVLPEGRERVVKDYLTFSDIGYYEPEVDTSDWKVYRDEKLGFEFKYPYQKQWELSDLPLGPEIQKGKAVTYNVEKYINVSVSVYNDVNEVPRRSLDSVESLEELVQSVGGYDVRQVVIRDRPGFQVWKYNEVLSSVHREFFLQSTQYVYVISLDGHKYGANDEEALMQQFAILSTFTILD